MNINIAFRSVVITTSTQQHFHTQGSFNHFSYYGIPSLGEDPTIVLLFLFHFVCPPSKKGGHFALLLSVCLPIGRSTNRFRSFCSQRLHILKRYLVCRFIRKISCFVWVRSTDFFRVMPPLTSNWNSNYLLSIHYLCKSWTNYWYWKRVFVKDVM